MTESELISRARIGDDGAWHELVYAHQEAVFRLAYLLLGDAHEAEDVAQEAFVRAFRALGTFDDARADYNGDDTISLADFTLLKTNFGQLGADPIAPSQ